MATLSNQPESSGPQGNTIPRDGGESHASRVEDARRELISQVNAIVEQARDVVPGVNDLLQSRADRLELSLNTIQNDSFSSQADVEQLIGNAKRLALDAKTHAELRDNPWQIKVWSPETGTHADRFHDVVSFRIPRNHAIEIRQDGQNGTTVHRICQGNFRDRPLGEGSQFWREPDPSDRNFDIITIATKNERQVQVNCRTEHRGAFEGQMRIRDLCTCESHTVNINNGQENRFGTTGDTPLSVNVSSEALIEPPKEIEAPPAPLRPDQVEEVVEGASRPSPEERIEFSPGDNYEAAGYRTFREYRTAMSQAAQLPPRHSVALVGAGLTFKLNSEHSEMLTLSQNALGTTTTFLPSAYSEAEFNSPDGVLIGVNVARIKRDTNDKSGQTFIIEPGGRHNSAPYSASITRIGATNGGDRVADSILYLGEEQEDQTTRPQQETLAEQAARTPPPIESLTVSSLPEPGAVVTESEGVKITLDDASLTTLMVYRNGSNIGVFQSNSRENEYRFGPLCPLVLTRDTSDGAPRNTFTLLAVQNPVEGRLDLWIRPFGSGEPQHTHIQVYADADKPVKVSDPTPATEPSQPQLQAASEQSMPISEPTAERARSSTNPWGLGERKITVPRGEVATFEYEYEVSIPGGKELRRSAEPYVFKGDTIKATIPNVGVISRRTLDDGSQEITFTPATGFNGQTNLQTSSQPVVARNPQSNPQPQRGRLTSATDNFYTAA